jgi:hypothetical protein
VERTPAGAGGPHGRGHLGYTGPAVAAGRVEDVLKPYGLTFATYEALRCAPLGCAT